MDAARWQPLLHIEDEVRNALKRAELADHCQPDQRLSESFGRVVGHRAGELDVASHGSAEFFGTERVGLDRGDSLTGEGMPPLAGRIATLRAQLSPNEETSLRKIAAGSTYYDRIQMAHLEQLVALELIEARDDIWQLTAMGHARMAIGKTTRK